MSYVVALSDGHGMETSGKRTPKLPTLGGRQIKENEFNRAVVALVDKDLKRHGIKTVLVAPTDADTSLAQRVRTANNAKANIYVSVHYNAGSGVLNSNQGGIETYYYGGSASSEKLARFIHNELIKGTTQRNRGLKKGNHLYEVNSTNMPAVLLECGFMDNEREALLMIDQNFQKETAVEITKGICQYFGVTYKAETVPPKVVPPVPTPKPEPEKEVEKVMGFNPQNQVLTNLAKDMLRDMQDITKHGDKAIMDVHLKALEAGTLTTDQLLGLVILGIQRGMFKSQ